MPRPPQTRFWPRGSRILYAPRPRSISVGVFECESVVRRALGLQSWVAVSPKTHRTHYQKRQHPAKIP